MLNRRTLILTALAMPAIARAATPARLRVSVESLPSHNRTISAADFCKKVEDASGGEIKTELFHSGQLFTDQTVVTALLQSQIDMSLPGTWGITGFVPSFDVMQLPIMYARPADQQHKVMDGKAGQMISAEAETKLKLHILGGWLDLGFENWYTSARKLDGLADLKGLKIRHSGGSGKAWRTSFLGAIPNTTPMPSVALSLSQGTFDGLITTNETVAANSLWESGIKRALEDHQTFNAYVPLMSAGFWNALAEPQRKLLTDVWAANLATWRANMAQAQIAAREKLIAHGVAFIVPTEADTEAARTRMLPLQDNLVKQWRITPAIATQAVADLA